mmetsp:Transcript_38052/g.56939  ORF Transcript_38052/g.56939 Transcript_38052/m.56939 type:complete len:82 (+) Transcript_38052:147-392(+)
MKCCGGHAKRAAMKRDGNQRLELMDIIIFSRRHSRCTQSPVPAGRLQRQKCTSSSSPQQNPKFLRPRPNRRQRNSPSSIPT